MTAQKSSPTIIEGLLENHYEMLVEESAIDPAIVAERGYQTATTKKELRQLGFAATQQDTLSPKESRYGLLMPVRWPHTVESPFSIYRPDHPRMKNGKKVKYEMPTGIQMALDSPPRCHQMLPNPQVPLWVTEGQKKGDAGASRGGCWLVLAGVWNWRGTNEHGGKTTLPELDDIAFNERKTYFVFDSDVVEKRPVYDALVRLKDVVERRGADVWIIHLPSGQNGEKVGVDDWFAANPSRTLHDLQQLASKDLVKPVAPQQIAPEHTKLSAALGDDAPVPSNLLVPLGYEIGSGGIMKVDIVGEGESMRERRISVAPSPIYISGIIEQIGGGDHQLVLVGRYRDQWVRAIATREQVMDSRKLISLANQGLPIVSGRAPLIAEYLDAFETVNMNLLPAARVATQMSWTAGGKYISGRETIRREST